jgi:hypothetical protein
MRIIIYSSRIMKFIQVYRYISGRIGIRSSWRNTTLTSFWNKEIGAHIVEYGSVNKGTFLNLNHWIDIYTSNLISDGALPNDTTNATVRKMPRQKPTLMIFNTEMRRTQHEQSWHSASGQQK